ncbi:predicted protein [Chaetomium globosum CBS 148.51]|uniref:Uncharacterized protein n=1 Tax=Chaetomium globosum (strain ATCC 6205 / CBS 148.51 / DSM 1962 / NBRC 6347 / NRRL 1970) TaxID=306901 RepID=Q2GZ87_CHAGB|nr:uncharacterized protein CHGG_05159 [Chaetomium globosum CBS 148.51]EAQ88540.1 predicted protein [Chaetomium globosum CBS 148.51]
MDNEPLAMLPQLLQAQRDFFVSQSVLVNMLIDDRNEKHNIIKSIKRLRYKLDDYILMDVPEPIDEADKQKWEKDRVDVDFYIQHSVPDYGVWTALKDTGWDITARDPKATLDKLTEYFFTLGHER